MLTNTIPKSERPKPGRIIDQSPRTNKKPNTTSETTIVNFLRGSPNPDSLRCRCLQSPIARSPPCSKPDPDLLSLEQEVLCAAPRIFHSYDYDHFEITFNLVGVRREPFQGFASYDTGGPLGHGIDYGPRYLLYQCELIGNQSLPPWSVGSSASSDFTCANRSSASGSHDHGHIAADGEDQVLVSRQYSRSPVSEAGDEPILLLGEVSNSRLTALQSLWNLTQAAESRQFSTRFLPIQSSSFRRFDGYCSACRMKRPTV